MCPQTLDAVSYVKRMRQVTGEDVIYLASYQEPSWSFDYKIADEDKNLSMVSDAS
jgi:hypothetical protein